MKEREKLTTHQGVTENGSVIGRKTMRLVRNQKGRSVMLSHDYSENSENMQMLSGKVPIGLLSTLKKVRSQKN